MARYNEWMNVKIFDACARIPPPQLHKNIGAFFQSIYLTLNHIAYADLAFLSRFTGDPASPPPLGIDLFEGDFHALPLKREQIDQRLLKWVPTLTCEWLRSTLTYVSNVDRQSRTLPHWVLLTHLFNHQTHHRGQVSTLLFQFGHDVGSTDIPFMPHAFDI